MEFSFCLCTICTYFCPRFQTSARILLCSASIITFIAATTYYSIFIHTNTFSIINSERLLASSSVSYVCFTDLSLTFMGLCNFQRHLRSTLFTPFKIKIHTSLNGSLNRSQNNFSIKKYYDDNEDKK